MNDLYLLDLKNKQAQIEFINIAAQADLQKYGEWQCDWHTARREAQEAFDVAREKYLREIIKP